METLESFAAAGTIGVNAAVAAIKCGARLRQLGFRFQPLHPQAEFLKSRRVIVDLQLDIGEERSVATHAAGGAEAGDGFRFREHGAS